MDDFFIVRPAGILEESDGLVVCQAFHEPHLGNGAVSAAIDDLSERPAQVFPRLLCQRHDVNGRLDRHRSHLQQPPPDFHSQGVGFGGDLMNQQQPFF
jgi:hypothetical protein